MKPAPVLRGLPRRRRLRVLNAAEHWLRIDRFADRLEALGDRFVVPMPGTGPWVGLTHPRDIERLFRAKSSEVHFGEALRMLSPHELVLGHSALTSLDGERHLAKRRQLLPLFHSEALKGYEPTITAKARTLAALWPAGRPARAHRFARRATLEVIMAVIFGVAEEDRLRRLRTAIFDLGSEIGSRRFLLQMAISNARNDGYERRFARVEACKDAIDAIVREEIADRERGVGAARPDALGHLMASRGDGGQPLSRAEICDHLRTLLVAGHDTIAATMAWVLERIVHTPAALTELERTVRNGDDRYLEAVIHETLRLRPVFPFTVRLT